MEKDRKESAAGSADVTSTLEPKENFTIEIEIEDIFEMSCIMTDKSIPNHFV